MKLAVCGKGGSGKSAMVALLANGMQHRGYHVLVVDSDESNSCLHRMLGFDKTPVPIMDMVGGRSGVKQKMAPRLPQGESTPQGAILEQSKIWLADIDTDYMLSRDGISLVSTGKILQSLEGCACSIGVLSREFLEKLCLKDNEVIIVDMEAGVEHFGRGVDASIDSVLIVVEPSFESLSLAEKINRLAAEIGIESIWVVLNKIASEELASKMKADLIMKNMAVIGSVSYDMEVFEACLSGRPVHSREAAKEIDMLLDTLLRARELPEGNVNSGGKSCV